VGGIRRRGKKDLGRRAGECKAVMCLEENHGTGVTGRGRRAPSRGKEKKMVPDKSLA